MFLSKSKILNKLAFVSFCLILASIFTLCSFSVKSHAAEDTAGQVVSAEEGEVPEEEQGLSERIARFFAGEMEGLPSELICFLVSMIPIVELRGGLIIAAILEVPLFRAILVCIVGNLIPVPFILWLITPIFNWLKKTKLFRGLVEKLEKKSMSKSDKIQKKQFWGLVIFVGIPLPGTGAWTGSLIASLLNIKVKKAFPAICVGLVMATIIMCFVSYGIPWLAANVF